MKITIESKEEKLERARMHAYAMPLKDFHPGAPRLFASDTLWPYFERLRNEEPVHYCTNCPIEPYWSVTKYKDIMHVETNQAIFSSDLALGGITIHDTSRRCSGPVTSTNWLTSSVSGRL
jgi:cytochrome P450